MTEQEAKFAEAARQAEAASAGGKPRRGWKYYAKRIAIDIVIGYALICLGVFFLQKKMVYQREQAESLAPADFGFAAAQAREISTQSSGGNTIRGWQITSFRGGTNPDQNLAKAPLVALFFCGNAGNKSDRGSKFRLLSGMGAEVVCFDYRGYGDSEGSPDEEGLAADARAAWDLLRKKGVPANRIVIHGESLGGGVATRLASELCKENTPPGGLILEATFPRLAAVAGLHYPYLPVSLILTQKFPSAERIPALTCPLLQFHGAKDDIIPLTLGRELFSAAPKKSSSGAENLFIELPDCDHNTVGTRNAAEYRRAITAFYQVLAPELIRKEKDEKAGERPPAERPERPAIEGRQRRERGAGEKPSPGTAAPESK